MKRRQPKVRYDEIRDEPTRENSDSTERGSVMVASDDTDLQTIIQEVRVLVKGEKNLDCPTTDEFLLRYIRASNYDVKLSFQLIIDYFWAKMEHPEEFVFGPASMYENTMNRLDLGFALKEKDYSGRRIGLLRFGDLNPSNEDWETLMQTATLVLEALSLDPETQEKGICLIIDCTNFSLKIMKWATPHKLKVTMKFLQDAIPLKFDFLHIVNAPLVYNIFFSALKPFMKEGFVDKLVWHKAPYSKLHRFVNPQYLPQWMGGTLNLESIKYWYKEVLDKESALNEFSKMGYKNIQV